MWQKGEGNNKCCAQHVHNIYTNIIWYIHDTYKHRLVGIHCAHSVTVTGVMRVGTEKHGWWWQ